MTIRFVTNVRDGKGLARDAEVLAALSRERGHEVEVVDFRDPPPPTNPDAVVMLEVIVEQHLRERCWFVPNPEWFFEGQKQCLCRFDKILCKSQDGLRLFAPLTDRAEYMGFISADRLDATVPREPRFWHNPGGSDVKGTAEIVAAWALYGIPYQLTVAGVFVAAKPIPNVTFVPRMSDADHKREQNRHLYHLCLSQYEGFGHYLHEALSVGAVVASTDHPPMTEAEAAIRVPIAATGKLRLATTGHVAPEDVRAAVERMAGMSDAEVAAKSASARAAYEAESVAFRARWSALVDSL